MIPVTLQPEPEPKFEEEVRGPGYQWLNDNGIDPNLPPPDPAALPTYWRETQKDLWDAYKGVCSYLCIYFAWPLGAHSTDHFVAQSKDAGQAYEWDNYRLSCLGMNRNKNRFDDVLDPFQIAPDTFILNLASGKISPNPSLPQATQAEVWATIRRLKLDAPETAKMRAEHYTDCLNGVPEWYLKKHSPFVWHEANRQGLL